jgi:alkaline phosphatase D
MVRVVQISDTHLSPTKTHFGANWAPIVRWIALQRPDLVIHTGDVTVDGAGEEEDARHAGALLRALGVPVLSVPGNHDVGTARDPHQPIGPERLGRWRRHLGEDRWLYDLPGWRLLGLNALLFGSGDWEEGRQWEWLERSMAEAAERQIAWFLHPPLFLDHPEEPDTGYWSVKPVPRTRALSLLHRFGVALVGSGHLHRRRVAQHGDTRFVWGPASGFLVGPDLHPPMGGAARLGAAVYEFDETRVSVSFANIPGLSRFWIDHVLHEVYPARETPAESAV